MFLKAPEGAATGATAGGLLGGALGWLAGIGALAIPGVGPFVAAGPIMAALGGAAVGATAGGITGTLVGLGIPELEAKQYDEKIRGGNITDVVLAPGHRHRLVSGFGGQKCSCRHSCESGCGRVSQRWRSRCLGNLCTGSR